MADFAASFVPIAVPAIPTGASADQLASFQANFTSNIVTTGNSLLQAYIALKDTDFYAVGDIPLLDDQFFTIDPSFISPINDARPDSPSISFDDLAHRIDLLAALAVPEAPALVTPDASVPQLTAAAPVITLPLPPSTDVGAAPGDAPSLETPTTPEAPSVVIPSVPTLEDLRLPDAPSVSLPDFSAVAPQNLLTPPTETFSYVDPGYASSLHDPLVLKLLADLTNGSYGIEPADEAALWFRARDRAAQQARAGVDQAARQAAASSFPLPPGFMYEAMAIEEDKGQKIISEANRDIALRRSELYVEGRKFTIDQVRGYEQIRINLYSATQERALNYSKAVVEMGIALYDARVKNFNAQLEAYKAEAATFESRVRGELAKAELYRTQIEAEGQRVQFNRAKLEAYRAQLDGINAVVTLYRTRVEAAQLFMQLQEQRLNVFRTQVQVFGERVKAKESEYGVYRAQISGQLAQLEIYKSQIDAYNATLASAKTRSEIQLQGNESLLQRFRASISSYQAQLDSFNKQIVAKLEQANTQNTVFTGEVAAYKAFVDASLAGAKIAQAQHDQVLSWNKASLAARVAQVDHRFKQLASSVELQKDVNKNGVEFLRTALGAATSGLNALGVKTQEG